MTNYPTNRTDLLKNSLVIAANDYKAFSKEVITVTTSIKKLNPPTGARYAVIQAQVGSGATTDSKLIRFFYADGLDTSSTNGHKLVVQYYK